MILGDESNWASIRCVRNGKAVSELLGVPYPASMGSAGNYSKEYLKCFVSEVNVQQYWGSFMRVRADGMNNA